MVNAVLDITTLIERPKIAIDGKLYEIKSPDELSVLDHHRMGAWGRRLDELLAQDSIGPVETDELSKVLTAISDFILVGVPDDVRDKLTDSHKMMVAEVFTVLPLHKQLGAMTQDMEASITEATQAVEASLKSTGAKRRRGSKGSTGATRRGGSTKRRSRS